MRKLSCMFDDVSWEWIQYALYRSIEVSFCAIEREEGAKIGGKSMIQSGGRLDWYVQVMVKWN